MKNVLLFCLGIVLLLNCKNAQKPAEAPSEGTNSQEGKPTSSLVIGCYAYDGNGSSVQFEITSDVNPVKGHLNYMLAEKDRNTGTFSGNLKDGKLIGTYTFQSEGTGSQREVAFLLKEGQLIEGYGEMNETGNAFKNRENISFSSTMPLSRTNCQQ